MKDKSNKGDQIDEKKLKEVIKADIKQRLEELENTSGGGISNLIEEIARGGINTSKFVMEFSDFLANVVACNSLLKKWDEMKTDGNFIINKITGN